MKTVWFIDDELELLEILEGMMEIITEEKNLNLNFKFVSQWLEANPVKGDLVIHDLMGIGKKVFVDGVEYLSCSGSLEKESDLPKPYDFKKIEDVLIAFQ